MLPNRHTYKHLGFKTLPITFGRKASPPPEWYQTDSDVLWKNAPANSNTALQAGVSGMFLLDPDTVSGEHNVSAFLDGKGIRSWKIKTWRSHTHHWLRTVLPDGVQWNGKLKDNMGDWRGKNGYGLAAPSFVRTDQGEGTYTLPSDNPQQVPWVEWGDIASLLSIGKRVELDYSYLTLPVPVLKRKLPRWAYLAAEQIANMDAPGEISTGERSWNSRSEAALSILMTSLLNKYSYRMVMKWCGDYRSDGWWYRSTAKAVHFLTNEGDRPELATMYNSSFDVAPKDEDVLRAMIAVLWYVSKTTGHVSNRDIQLLVARGRQSVSGSISRLLKSKHLTLVETSVGTKASLYQVNTTVSMETRCTSVVDGSHPEVFRHGGLTHKQISVLDTLSENKTPKQISDESGVGLSGVYYALNKLEKYDLVTKVGKRWCQTKLSPDQINSAFHALDSSAKRKNRIALERSIFSSRKS